MDRDDEFRKHAADAQQMADRVISPIDKQSWLRIAQGWLSLIRNPKPTGQELLDAHAKAPGTGGSGSD
jgi:hypothetical protein